MAEPPERAIEGLDHFERLATASWVARLGRHPLRYVVAQLHGRVMHPLTGRPLEVRGSTFWGEPFQLALPAARDIFILGGKSHQSELRLTRYCVNRLRPDSVVFDVGAHFGFYSLLFARLAPAGVVVSFEPSPRSYRYLVANVAHRPNVRTFNRLLAGGDGAVTFFEYPLRYSEYNTIDDAQFDGSRWRRRARPEVSTVRALALDDVCSMLGVVPDFVKIDVEGAEAAVIAGSVRTLAAHDVEVAVEVVAPRRRPGDHLGAARALADLGYVSHAITPAGTLVPVGSIPEHLEASGLESDNIVFTRRR